MTGEPGRITLRSVLMPSWTDAAHAASGIGPSRRKLPASTIAQDGVMAVPKAAQAGHLRENWAARAVALDASDRAAIDRAFPPPRRKTPLAMT